MGAWLYDTSLGIARDENSPGFQHFIIKPQPDPTGGLSYAVATTIPCSGASESSWEKSGAGYQYRFVVPANTRATLYLPAQQERTVLEGGQRAAKAAGVKFLRLEKGKAVYELSAGTYSFFASEKESAAHKTLTN